MADKNSRAGKTQTGVGKKGKIQKEELEKY